MNIEDQAVVTAEINTCDEEIGISSRRLYRSVRGWRV